jgi:FkbM family methyltransferase
MSSNTIMPPLDSEDAPFHVKVRRIFGRKHPGRYLASRLLLKSKLSRLITFETNGYRMRFYPTDLSAHLWYKRESRARDISLLRSYLQPGEVYLDVGANIGSTVIAGANAVGAQGQVLAFEPHPRVFEYLVGNVALNKLPNVQGFNVALGAEAATSRLTDSDSDDTNHVVSSGHGGVTIRVETLDSLTEAQNSIDLMKIDVEGFEAQVLAGAMKTLKKTSGIYIEISDGALRSYGSSSSEIIGLLRREGFVLFRWRGDTTLEEIHEPDPTFPHHENVMATKDKSDLQKRLAGRIALA